MKTKKKTISKFRKDYEEYLNEIGTSRDDLYSYGGRIPDRCKYGTWLRKNDPIAFNVEFNEFMR